MFEPQSSKIWTFIIWCSNVICRVKMTAIQKGPLPLNGNQLSWFNTSSQEDRAICSISQLFDSCVSIHDRDPPEGNLISVLGMLFVVDEAFPLRVKPVFLMAAQPHSIQDLVNIAKFIFSGIVFWSVKIQRNMSSLCLPYSVKAHTVFFLMVTIWIFLSLLNRRIKL